VLCASKELAAAFEIVLVPLKCGCQIPVSTTDKTCFLDPSLRGAGLHIPRRRAQSEPG